MTFDDYQEGASYTAIKDYFGGPDGLYYLTLGLAGEAGEVANVVKKAIRDDEGAFTEARISQITDELGDVLWYMAMLARRLDIRLSDVAKANQAKLRRRHKK